MSWRMGLAAVAVATAALTDGCMASRTGAPGAANIAPAEGEVARVAADEHEPPVGRLPADVRPTHYALRLRIVPERERFDGHARIRAHLTVPRSVVWMHGRGLDVAEVWVHAVGREPLAATWDPVPDSDGLVALRLAHALDPGDVVIEVRYSAPFDEQLKGLYRVRTAGDAYAFTQFEATWARGAFPGFDEPSAKAPFDVELEVRREHVALANTPEVSREPLPDGLERVRFATTPPLPTYLVAWAVGPLDVVEAPAMKATGPERPPVPLRGVAIRGKGPQLARALSETPAILASLEGYLGMPYPYRKLDIVAVPDFAAGAMENVGLVTFRDTLLLMDGEPPEWQKRAFAHVMAHELAHQWFGNLVTMPWWDDLWLNEAFATWLGHRTVQDVYPDYQASLALLNDVVDAMRSDSLRSARRIREPIASSHDIRSAFDAITYDKGAAVLGMFERWLGEQTFQRGLARYLRLHAGSTATTDDLLRALGAEAEQDMAGPFRSFLDQAGVPQVEVVPSCTPEGTRLSLRQTRYLPVGSGAEGRAAWKVPMCTRMGMGPGRVDEHCFLLEEPEQEVLLEGDRCADWIHPNGDGAGYYRFTLPAEQWKALRERGWSVLSARDKLSLADSAGAAFSSADLPLPTMFDLLPTFARSGIRPVAEVPMELVELARDRLVATGAKRDAIDRYGRQLYAPVWRRLGWQPKAGESSEDRMLRASVAHFLALVVEEPRVRKEAARRGLDYLAFHGNKVVKPEAVSPDLVSTVLKVAVQEGGVELFEHAVRTAFEVSDPLLRGRLLSAAAHVREPELAARARELTLDPRMRMHDVLVPLRIQLRMPETREAAWQWLVDHYDAVVERVATTRRGDLPWLGASFCSDADAERVEAHFEPRLADLPGGPRALAGAVEAVRLCAARVAAHREAAERYF
jgi:cytosol alanyl aminopeptidase